ncbi:G-protein coupled receptor 143-like [Pecten maximus]|uniref:G-protein coupled receptor 143-like n=1 Tax=Pecten maximus TaxID=6579 RepID=UPI0014591684|nr:G-protein coupled receptor 143-like [Pecten maximus]
MKSSSSTCHSLTDDSFIPRVNTEVKIAGGILEAFTDFSYVASSLWTLSFAINIYSQLVGRHIPVKVFHLGTWLGSSVSVTAGLVAVYMGTDRMSVCPGQERIFWRYLSTYVPMAFTLVMICVLYWKASISVSLSFTKLTATVGREERAIIQRLRMRFFWIVFFFALCWLPNIVDCFLHIDLLSEKCMYQLDGLLFPLWIIEALMNPLQGLFNCFLYGRKCSCRPFVFTARTRRHYTQIVDTDRSYNGLLNNLPDTART